MDLCLINGWILYVRDFEATGLEGNHLSLYKFKTQVSYSLRNHKRPLDMVGQPKKDIKPQRKIYRKRKLPPKDVMEDQVCHFPIVLPKRGVCRNTPCTSQITSYCMKCRHFLCVGNRGKQCFLEFHGIAYDVEDYPR